MLEASVTALQALLDPTRFAFMLAGVSLGITVAMIPGLSGSTALAILIPFVFGMDPINGIALLIGIASISNTADTFPAVLIGVPGSNSAQATIMDGYPLAKQGKATTALSADFIASGVGGVIGAMALFAGIWLARPLVMALGSPELFMLAILGISMVGVLSKGAPLLGMTSGMLGLLVGAIGIAPNAPTQRFTFDTYYLSRGLPLAVISIGLFAIPEILELLASKRPISRVPQQKAGRREGLRAVIEHRWLVVRMSIIGNLLGIIPGIGGGVIDWITYGTAKQTLKDTDGFGKGDIRGVIAPGAATNAKEGGVLLPTLLFGIPGSSSMALLLGAFLVMGVSVGPPAVTTNLHLTITIVWTIALANIFATLLCLGLSGPIGRLCQIQPAKLMPYLLIIVVVAAFQSTRQWGDILVLMFFGVLGWVMRRIRCPRPPFLIGFVLATPIERYLMISMERFGLGWLSRPGVVIIAIAITALAAGGPLVRRLGRSRDPQEVGA